jgi:hypothetical protein
MTNESVNLMAMISAQLTKIIDQRINLMLADKLHNTLQSTIRNVIHAERDYFIGLCDTRIKIANPGGVDIRAAVRELSQEGGLNDTIDDAVENAVAEYLDNPGNIDQALSRADLTAVVTETLEGMDVTLKFN